MPCHAHLIWASSVTAYMCNTLIAADLNPYCTTYCSVAPSAFRDTYDAPVLSLPLAPCNVRSGLVWSGLAVSLCLFRNYVEVRPGKRTHVEHATCLHSHPYTHPHTHSHSYLYCIIAYGFQRMNELKWRRFQSVYEKFCKKKKTKYCLKRKQKFQGKVRS